MAYGIATKSTTISVKLADSDLKLLDSIRPKVDGEKLKGNIDPDARWGRWGEASRSEALRAALRKTAADLQQGKTKTPASGKTAADPQRKTARARKSKTKTPAAGKTARARKGQS